MNKPKVICHMTTTVDGRIITENWRNETWASIYVPLFEKYHYEFESEAWILGRVSMEKDFSGGVQPDLIPSTKPIERKAFVGDSTAKTFAIAVDGKGKLGWNTNEVDGDHIIELLTESVSDEYLYYLQRRNISYIFAGQDELNFPLALHRLTETFPIKTLMLEGGGHLNGSFLNEGLIDELSLLIIPVADGMANTATLFEVSTKLFKHPATLMELQEIKQVEGGTLWIKYQINPLTTSTTL